MKKIFSLINILFVIILLNAKSTVYSEIIRRRATLQDVTEILNIQRQFDNDDKNKLLIYPDEKKRDNIVSTINKNKLFVSIDTRTNNIVNIIKLFVIETRNEFNEILEELGFRSNGTNKTPAEFFNDFNYNVNIEDIRNVRKIETSLLQDIEIDNFLNFPRNCVYIYYGGAYTLREYRNQGINFHLIKYALNTVISEQAGSHHNPYMSLLYGQVDANKNNMGMIRAFAEIIMHHNHIDFINLQHLICEAFKPTLIFANSEIQVIHENNDHGEGNIVFVKI